MIYLLIFILSIWNTILFTNHEYGLSVSLYVVPLLLIILYGIKEKIKNKKGLFFLIPIFLLSLNYFIFDNYVLRLFNFFMIPFLTIIMIIITIHDRFDIITIKKYFFKTILKPLDHMGSVYNDIVEKIKKIFCIKKNDDGEYLTEEQKNKLHQIFITVIVTVPLTIFIIMLLSSADMMFKNMFKGIIDFFNECLISISSADMIERIICIGITFFYISALIFYLSKHFNDDKESKCFFKNNSLNNVFTIKTVLTVLNVVYIIFSFIQIRSLFFHYVVENINYAEYARSGFFQLMLVSFINLIIILISNNKYLKTSKKDNIYINIMGTIMIICTYIILSSSFMRMYLYEAHYGYTQLRLLVYVALITEAVLLIPTLIYIFTNKLNLFKTYFIILMIAYFGINYMDMDSMIAKKNINRYFSTGKIDIYYLTYLSDDVVDEMKYLYDNTNDEDIKYVIEDFFDTTYNEDDSFQSFNISRYKANKIIKNMTTER